MGKRLFLLGRLTQVLWLRAALFCLAAVAAVLLAHVLAPFVPTSVPTTVGEDAAEELLKIIASSMLAVATFSLATMVAAVGSVMGNTSPRAAGLLLDDRSAQNALSSFIAAFIFSVVGLVAVGARYFTAEGRFVLFLMTLAVLVLVIMRLLKWIDQLSRLGRVGHVIDRVEQATRQALQKRQPFLGGRRDGEAPPGCIAVLAREVGYVQHIDVAHLDAVAGRERLIVHLALLPGAFVRLSRPLLFVEGAQGKLDAKVEAALVRSVVVGDARTFQQDPRFGLVVLAEIASRALSPAVNDPGTAIDVVGTAVRLLSVWAENHWEEEAVCKHPHVAVPPLSAADFFDDVFRPVARDGAGMVEVGAALQKAFADLSTAKAAGFAEAARHHSQAALNRAEQGLTFEDDKQVLRRLAAQVEASPSDSRSLT
ncbi:MAG: DUF2254 domain-containing protein [Proteobacteria bacterium]|nr:DUF2254 domain-containing protein [Pseudomonadota bacterium]